MREDPAANAAAPKTGLDRQVGGGHYKELGCQPLELTYLNYGYEGLRAAVYCKVNKYQLRTKGDPVVNLEKAIHCLEIQLEFLKKENNDAT